MKKLILIAMAVVVTMGITVNTHVAQATARPDEGINCLVFGIPPSFPGGDAALMKYIKSHIQYPESAKADSIQGRVVTQFVVTKTGTVRDVILIRGVHPDLNREALRVVESLPPFEPGRNENGELVDVKYTLPVTFKL